MGTRSRMSSPPAPIRLREYRGATLPAFERPRRVLRYCEPDADPEVAFEWELDMPRGRMPPCRPTPERTNRAVAAWAAYGDAPAASTRVLMAGARRDKQTIGTSPRRGGSGAQGNQAEAPRLVVMPGGHARSHAAPPPVRRDTGPAAPTGKGRTRRPVTRAARTSPRLPALAPITLALVAVVGAALVMTRFTTAEAGRC